MVSFFAVPRPLEIPLGSGPLGAGFLSGKIDAKTPETAATAWLVGVSTFRTNWHRAY
jgi:hypothetical protein